jgi:hypothetical protein
VLEKGGKVVLQHALHSDMPEFLGHEVKLPVGVARFELLLNQHLVGNSHSARNSG